VNSGPGMRSRNLRPGTAASCHKSVCSWKGGIGGGGGNGMEPSPMSGEELFVAVRERVGHSQRISPASKWKVNSVAFVGWPSWFSWGQRACYGRTY